MNVNWHTTTLQASWKTWPKLTKCECMDKASVCSSTVYGFKDPVAGNGTSEAASNGPNAAAEPDMAGQTSANAQVNRCTI